MQFLKYLKNNAWEYVLCVIMTACLALNVLQGFYLPENLQTNIFAIAAFSALCCFLLFCCGYNKKTIILGILAVLALIVFSIVSVQSVDLSALEGQELEESIPYFYIMTFVCSAFVYLLSRRKAGSIILAVFGAVIICIVVFMEFQAFWVSYVLYMLAAVAMCFYRNYRINAVNYTTVKPAFGAYTGIAAALSAGILALSVLISVLIIQPLNLPVSEFKPFTRYLTFEILEISATSSNIVLPDPNNISNNTNDNIKTSHNESDPDQDNIEYQEVIPPLDNLDTYMLNYDNLENFLFAIRYTLSGIPAIVWLLLIPLIIGLIIGGKVLQRKLWFKRVQKNDRSAQICILYRFFLSRFAKLNYKRPDSDTPMEYARRVGDKLRGFRVKDADLTSISQTFVKVGYGELNVTDEEYAQYVAFYNNFYKAAKDKLGFWGYARKFLFL